jgi:hypothetical protein
MTSKNMEILAPDGMILPSARKAKTISRTLNGRDRQVVEFLLESRTQEEAAVKFNISRPRISQIMNTPAALAFVASRAYGKRTIGYATVIDLIVDRVNQAVRLGYTIPLDELIKVAKLLEPKQETSEQAYEMIYAEAERIADEYGLTGEKRGQFLRFVAERAA